MNYDLESKLIHHLKGDLRSTKYIVEDIGELLKNKKKVPLDFINDMEEYLKKINSNWSQLKSEMEKS